MLINLRKKESSSSVLNLTTFADPAVDESFCESTVSKRFTRKKNTSNQHARNLRTTKPADQPPPQTPTISKQPVKNKANACTVKPEDLFLRITHTPTKGKNGYTPASSDRATQSTYLKSRIETEGVYMQSAPLRKDCPMQLKEELELKRSELMLLEDEVMRLKRDLGNKEQQFLKNSIRKEKEYQAEINKLTEELQQIKHQLHERTAQVKQFKKTEAAMNRQIKALKYDKLMLEKQMQQIYKKRLPKELKELMSFRQISLTKQIQQLKEKLELSKTENENKLQAQVHKLKHQNSEHKDMIKRLQVHSRILNRRIVESEQSLKEKSQAFVKLYNALKENNNQLKEQIKNIRKENLKLKRLQVLHPNHHPHPHSHHKKKHSNLRSSSEQSLSLSLSSNN